VVSVVFVLFSLFLTYPADGCDMMSPWGISICVACGRNICHACQQVNQSSLAVCQPGSDQPHTFVPGTFFSEADLKAEILRLEEVPKHSSFFRADIYNSNLWCGEATVIGCDIKTLFTPSFFIERYKNVVCVVASRDGTESSTTVDRFFLSYGNSGQSGKTLKV
jgi:hypothetical protein